MNGYAQRWQFKERFALSARALAELLAKRARFSEDVVGYRLGSAATDPLLVPALSALFVPTGALGDRIVKSLREHSLRVDQPEGVVTGLGDAVAAVPAVVVLSLHTIFCGCTAIGFTVAENNLHCLSHGTGVHGTGQVLVLAISHALAGMRLDGQPTLITKRGWSFGRSCL